MTFVGWPNWTWRSRSIFRSVGSTSNHCRRRSASGTLSSGSSCWSTSSLASGEVITKRLSLGQGAGPGSGGRTKEKERSLDRQGRGRSGWAQHSALKHCSRTGNRLRSPSKCHRRRGSTTVAILFTVLQKGYPSAESHADTQARLTSHAAQVSSCRAGSFRLHFVQGQQRLISLTGRTKLLEMWPKQNRTCNRCCPCIMIICCRVCLLQVLGDRCHLALRRPPSILSLSLRLALSWGSGTE